MPQGGVNNITSGRGPGKKLLYSHPAATAGRKDGAVWQSTDQGASFSPFLHVSQDPSVDFAYSCMTMTHTKWTVGLSYESTGDASGCHGASCQIRYMTFETVDDNQS